MIIKNQQIWTVFTKIETDEREDHPPKITHFVISKLTKTIHSYHSNYQDAVELVNELNDDLMGIKSIK